MKIKNLIKVICVIMLCQLAMTSCSSREDVQLIDIAPDYINSQVLLRTASYLNTYKVNDPIFLELKYNSTNVIVFPNNYNLRIFYKASDAWVEISEEPTQRFPPGDIIFSPDKQIPLAESVVVHPDLPNQIDNYYLRIYVVGEMKLKDGVKRVAAYTELKISP